MSDYFIPKSIVTNWLYLGIVLVLGMVVIGGITRLTHSGLSMTQWSFAGSLPPTTNEAWQAEFELYQASPEFKEVHTHFTLEDFQSIYWWEYIHRMFGRMIGVIFIIPFVFFLWKRWIPKDMLKHFLIILALGAFQALLGWFMVKSGLVDVPRVSHYRLAAHLSTAFIACSYIFWVAMRYRNYGQEEREVTSNRKWAVWIGSAVFIQIIYGAFVAGLRAGWIHNTWPLMDGSIISPAVTALEPLISNFFEGRSGVQFVHRTLGLVVLILAIVLWRRSLSWSPRLMRASMFVCVAIGIQFLLGVITLLMEVPIYMGVIHQVFALIVLLAIIHLYYQHSFRPSGATE
jgi:cytochrome c oxidase assembly protein subunit 15